MSINDKRRADRLEKYKKIHAAVLAFHPNKVDWEALAKEFGYKPQSLKTTYYQHIVPELKEAEENQVDN